MKNVSKLNATLLVAAVSTAVATFAATSHADDKVDMTGKEKCYGVAKAGKNDCAGGGSSCSGSAKEDGQGFLVVPKGLCEKLSHGSLMDAAKK